MIYAEREKAQSTSTYQQSFSKEEEEEKEKFLEKAHSFTKAGKVYYVARRDLYYYHIKEGDDLNKIAQKLGLSGEKELLNYTSCFDQGMLKLRAGDAIHLEESIMKKVPLDSFDDCYAQGKVSEEHVYSDAEKKVKKVILPEKYIAPALAPKTAKQGEVHYQLLDGKYYYSVMDGEGVEELLLHLHMSISDVDLLIQNSHFKGFNPISGEIIDQHGQERFLQKGEAIELKEGIVERLPLVLVIPRFHGDLLLDRKQEQEKQVEDTVKDLGQNSLEFQQTASEKEKPKKKKQRFQGDPRDKVNYDFEEINREFRKIILDNNQQTGAFQVEFTQAIGFEQILYVYVTFGAGLGMGVGDARKFQVGANISIGGKLGVDAEVFETGVEFTQEWASSSIYNSMEEYLVNLHWEIMKLLHEKKLISENTLNRFLSINQHHLDKGFIETLASTQEIAAMMSGLGAEIEMGGSETTYKRTKNDSRDQGKISQEEYAEKIGFSLEKLKKHREKTAGHQDSAEKEKGEEKEKEVDKESEQHIKLKVQGLGELELSFQKVDHNPNVDNNGRYMNLSLTFDEKFPPAYFILFEFQTFFDKNSVKSLQSLSKEMSKDNGDGDIVKRACEVLKISIQTGLQKYFQEHARENASTKVQPKMEWNWVHESDEYKLQYFRMSTVLKSEVNTELKTPTGFAEKTKISASGHISQKEIWATDTLSYASAVYNACMGEAQSDEEKEAMLMAYQDNLAPHYWKKRKGNSKYEKSGDKAGWSEIRQDHETELKKLCENFFTQLLNNEVLRTKQWNKISTWTQMKLMTVSPQFMEKHFGESPRDVFDTQKPDAKVHASGIWLQNFYTEDLDEGTLAFSNSNLSPSFLIAFEKHILFNLYIDREKYSFEYWNSPKKKK